VPVLTQANLTGGPESGWWDLAGWKLTTYRLVAEQTVNQFVTWLHRSNASIGDFPRCRTAVEPLLAAAETSVANGVMPPEFGPLAVEQVCANEWAVHLDNVMLRRTSWRNYHRDATQKAERVADWMGELLSWTDAERRNELAR